MTKVVPVEFPGHTLGHVLCSGEAHPRTSAQPLPVRDVVVLCVDSAHRLLPTTSSCRSSALPQHHPSETTVLQSWYCYCWRSSTEDNYDKRKACMTATSVIDESVVATWPSAFA